MRIESFNANTLLISKKMKMSLRCTALSYRIRVVIDIDIVPTLPFFDCPDMFCNKTAELLSTGTPVSKKLYLTTRHIVMREK